MVATSPASDLKAAEKKIEILQREKTLQDRMIREFHENLHQKATLTELNMFEAKLAGFATKEEVQKVYHMQFDYTRAETTERLINLIKSFERGLGWQMRCGLS